MHLKPRLLVTIPALVLIVMWVTSAFATGQTPPKSLVLNLEPDNLLSLIQPSAKQTAEAKAALKIYYENAIPLAKTFGYRNHGTLAVTETVVGNQNPRVFVLASWPNEAADLSFESQPGWEEFKALRPVIWDQLRFYKASIQQAKTLTFSEQKFYTLALAWLDKSQPTDYAEYLRGITSTVTQVGGKFIHSMRNPRFVSHTNTETGPDEITFVEWDSLKALNHFQQSEGFRQHAPLLKSGTQRFELYRIKPVFK